MYKGVQYSPTQLGMATVASSLSPHDALWVFSELSKARKNFALENELHILYQVEFGNMLTHTNIVYVMFKSRQNTIFMHVQLLSSPHTHL